MDVHVQNVTEIVDAAAAAAEAGRLNDRLVDETTIPEAVADDVATLLEAVDRTALTRWESVDPHHALVVLRAALRAQRVLTDRVPSSARAELRVALEAIRQALTAIAESAPVAGERSTKVLVSWLATRTEVAQPKLAGLLGVSSRQLQRWLSPNEAAHPEGDDARKVRLVARLVNQLQYALTPAGTVDWFSWPRSDLDGRAPRDLLDDSAHEPALQRAGASMRSQAAA